MPLFGVFWRIDEKWSLLAAAPLTARFTYKGSDRWRLGLLLTPSGDRYRFDNEDGAVFAGQPDEVFLRISGLRLGAEIEFQAGGHVALGGQAGILAGRRLVLTDADNDTLLDAADEEVLDAKVKPAAYARLFARFTLGKSLVDKLQ